MKSKKPLLLAITGATGMLYVPALLRLVAASGIEVHAVISQAGSEVLRMELGLHAKQLPHVSTWFNFDNFAAQPASGSALYRGMLILPCTAGTMGAIAAGYCANLIHRAADVTLKEKRPLILAFRETPLNRTHLRNMLALEEAGAILCPPMPAFYKKPKCLEDIAHSFALRLCDLLEIVVPESDQHRWQGDVHVE